MPERLCRRAALRGGAAAVALVWLAGCASAPLPPEAPEVAGLSLQISRLDTAVDAGEAARLAQIAVSYSRELRRAYGVTDSPLIHNSKVNLGLRPRGLCWHWADDLQARLEAEDFATLRFHRAIANADNSFRIDHSTLIVSGPEQALSEGVVLDPWRNGGVLFWAPVRADTDYDWVPRQSVFAERARRSVPQ